MERIQIKKTLDREIEKVCRMKAIDFSTLELNSQFNLLGSGIFDSLGILQLLMTLEEELGAEVDLSEYSPSEFTGYTNLIEILETSR